MDSDHADEGVAISYEVLPKGTPVHAADGPQVGTVRRSLGTGREHIFDGIVLDTPQGRRFVDAPEVARLAERRVTLTISAAEARDLPEHPGFLDRVGARLTRAGRRQARRLRRR